MLIRKAKMDRFDFDATLRPKQEPEVVALKNQTVEEVKNILRCAAEEECRRRQEALDAFEELTEECEKLEKDCKLSYENDSVECDECCNLDKARENTSFKKDMGVFALWRKLASVELDSEVLEIENLNPTAELMEYILARLKKSFPLLKLNWLHDCWNPRLEINGCSTHITVEKLALSYQGLLNITNELSAQAIVANVVSNKLKELFV